MLANHHGDIHPPPQRCCATANHHGDHRLKYLGSVNVMAEADDAREPKRRIECLPQDIVFDILLRLPARVLHNTMRHVSTEWDLMIRSPDFIHHHLRNSIGRIMLQEEGRSFTRHRTYVEMRRGGLGICKHPCRFGDVILSSCNGLVLAYNFRDLRILCVINLLTKQQVLLPPYFRQLGPSEKLGLAFAEASMEYKVVHANDLCERISVLTVGVDKVWRHISIGHTSLATVGALQSSPLVTGGYIHWIGDTFVLTLNIETETIRSLPMPQLGKGFRNFLPMGTNLSFVYESSKFLRDFWEMNPETGKWTMLLRFDLEPLTSRFKDLYLGNLIPFGWLAAREVLLFSTSCIQRCVAAYNLKTREIRSFELGIEPKKYRFLPLVSSLVWLEG